jgi:hypothetical protein
LIGGDRIVDAAGGVMLLPEQEMPHHGQRDHIIGGRSGSEGTGGHGMALGSDRLTMDEQW